MAVRRQQKAERGSINQDQTNHLSLAEVEFNFSSIVKDVFIFKTDWELKCPKCFLLNLIL